MSVLHFFGVCQAYKGCKRDGFLHKYSQSKGKVGCHVPQEQLNAWIHINGQKSCIQGVPQLPVSDIEHDCRVCSMFLYIASTTYVDVG